MKDLKSGLLQPLLQRVHDDPTLELEIRDDYINVYYRGGSLLKLESRTRGYHATFARRYLVNQQKRPLHQALAGVSAPASTIRQPAEVEDWLAAFPSLKLAIDLSSVTRRAVKTERAVQQLLVEANNTGRAARGTDYYVCDIEYANAHGRFDFVAVRWPSISHVRKKTTGRRLVLGELKYGDRSISDPETGLAAHVDSVNRFLDTPGALDALKVEMVEVFNQKRELGLLECGKDLQSFDDRPPVLLLVLADTDPDSSKLRTALPPLVDRSKAELKVAMASFVGLGLYDEGMVPAAGVVASLGPATPPRTPR